MKLPKFKKGDDVKTWNNSRAKIDRLVVKEGVNHYEITYIESKKTDTYKESELKFWLFNIDEEPPTRTVSKMPDKCPKCGSEWSVTRFGAKKWHDCLQCGKKAEDLVTSFSQGSSDTKKKESNIDDLLLEFESMLGVGSDDDDDGWW